MEHAKGLCRYVEGMRMANKNIIPLAPTTSTQVGRTNLPELYAAVHSWSTLQEQGDFFSIRKLT